MKSAGHVALMGEIRNSYNILIGKHEWKRPLGRFRYIRMNVREIRREGVDWMHLAHDRDKW
jgi:hypothetical protein